MKMLTVFVASLLLAGPAMAQSSEEPATDAPAQTETPKMCEMMHNGVKMRGMMVTGEDGKMTCRMMDRSQMDHGMMNHSQMDHGAMGHPQNGETATTANQTEHAGHEGHGPN
ncbi:hypothetical protein [Thauera propionica]|uniref:hypothetical protein n=1 Tax=Thauera propionica TaxID=2019431 RepID=UPI0023F06A73|nr:hypothetical protein [Thauera propionica]MDD3677389.1 hypothetical protein [Thauera propionica]